ncbi:major facilitator superfamily domain-containing protein [Astrocystis sublimbata]|nr:major facilitator superfamily domain-containing protein [Astrocystis sublimbata]
MANSSFLSRYFTGWSSVDFWLCTTLMYLVEFGCALLAAPSPRLLEIFVCQEYYRDNERASTQRDCKIQEVQIQLGFVLTVLSTCSVFAATLMQIPMGFLADRKGRKAALFLNIISTILYWGWIPLVTIFTRLPPWTLYIAPIFILVGGGPWASGALIFSAINRRTTPSQRTPAFSIMEATSGIADLVGPALGALTMEQHIWMPFLLAISSFTFMLVPALLLEDEAALLHTEVGHIGSEENGTERSSDEEQPLLRGLNDNTNGSRIETSSSVHATHVVYAIVFGSFFLLSMARDSNNFLIPWIAWRFDESMAEAGLIFSLRAIVSSILFFVLLPLASSYASNKLGASPSSQDLTLSTISAILLCIGSVIMALSPSLTTLVAGFSIMTLGSGASISLRAFLSSRVDKSSSGRLFAIIAATSTIGNLVGMPLMGALYSLNISTDIFVSFPFFLASGAYCLVVCIIGFLQFAI